MIAKRINQNGRVIVLSDTTDEPITMMGEMAGTCWGADTSDHIKNHKRGNDCIQSEHGRVEEYPQVYLVISGYSARVMRELYTHIGGAPTRLQESTRYVDCSSFDYVIPPTVQDNPRTLAAYQDTMRKIAENIARLEEFGVPREDSAMMLPLGMTTKVVIRINLRQLIDMSRQRLCNRAYWEFRQLMADIIDALSVYSDEWYDLIKVQRIFKPKCEVLGRCPEKHSCGRYKDNWFRKLENYCYERKISPTSLDDLLLKLREYQENGD